MLKIAVSYSKKVPGAQEYSSEGFHVALETEVPEALLSDSSSLQQHIQSLFADARNQVDAQVPGDRNPRPAGQGLAHGRNGHGSGRFSAPSNRKASPKQINYLVSLAKRKLDLTPAALAQQAGVHDLGELEAVQASQMIDELKREGS